MEGFVEESSESEISNLNSAVARHHDVGRLQVPVEHPVGVEIQKTVEELIKDRLDGRGGDWVASRLSVVVDDLEKIMLGVFKYHEDTLVFEDYLD